jgi:5-methylcytosine-specific restriction endonuclease McrA
MDERKTKGGITLTDNFYRLGEQYQYDNLAAETESRWRLVETAWELNLPKHLIQIDYKEETREFFADNKLRRVAVTGASPSLNGYQKGRCFYCFRDISLDNNHTDFADVDHFFPHDLRKCDAGKPINGVANLVLACTDCNRGVNVKFAKLPSLPLLARLHERNEYLITSHHPLRETLIVQTGCSTEKRQQFLQDAYSCSINHYGFNQKWQPVQQGVAIF